MQISPISFGKVIKVEAPENIVKKIVFLANEDNKESRLSCDLNAIFNDKKEGPVKSCNSVNGSYLVSGKDISFIEKKVREYAATPMKCYNFVSSYLLHNTEGIMTVAHDGKTVKAIDMII